MVAASRPIPPIKVPISGIGGIQAWQDAVEFLLLGATSVQVCTAVMHYGFRIVEHLQERPRGLDAREGLSDRSARSSAARCRGSSHGASST